MAENGVTRNNGNDSRIVARNRKRWLEEALEVLVEEGPHAVSVKRIAARLGTSRSPFFRVFGNREELLRQMFDLYNQETTIKTFHYVRRFTGKPLQRFWYFWVYIIEKGIYRLDRPYRWWSMLDPTINDRIRVMDQERIEFLCKLYRELGYSDEETEHRASFAYSEYIGILVAGHDDMSIDDLKRRAMFRFYLHTLPPMPDDFCLPDLSPDVSQSGPEMTETP